MDALISRASRLGDRGHRDTDSGTIDLRDGLPPDPSRGGHAEAARADRARRTLATADGLVIGGVLLGTSSFIDPIYGDARARTATTALVLVASLAAWLSAMSWQKLHVSRYVARRLDETRRIASTGVAAALLTVVAAYVVSVQLSRSWLVATTTLALAGLLIEREVARTVFGRRRRSGLHRRRVLVVGDVHEADEIVRMLADPTLGYEVAGTIATVRDPEVDVVSPVLTALESTEATGVVIVASGTSTDGCSRLARRLTDLGVHVELSSPLVDIAVERLSLHRLGRVPVLYIEPVVRNGWRQVAKRTFDITVAGVALLCSAPIWVVVSILIKLDSQGPVLFRQERIGRDGVRFHMTKFRSMVDDATERLIDLRELNEADGPLFKMKDDPRVTRVGRILRSTSIDEIPQLLNVLRGEMSLVGPRPALPAELESWDDRLFERLRVSPGITGMWQVSGRSSSSFADYSRLDLYYVDNWSLPTDLAIVAKTVPAVLFRRGAY